MGLSPEVSSLRQVRLPSGADLRRGQETFPQGLHQLSGEGKTTSTKFLETRDSSAFIGAKLTGVIVPLGSGERLQQPDDSEGPSQTRGLQLL